MDGLMQCLLTHSRIPSDPTCLHMHSEIPLTHMLAHALWNPRFTHTCLYMHSGIPPTHTCLHMHSGIPPPCTPKPVKKQFRVLCKDLELRVPRDLRLQHMLSRMARRRYVIWRKLSIKNFFCNKSHLLLRSWHPAQAGVQWPLKGFFLSFFSSDKKKKIIAQIWEWGRTSRAS